MPTDNPNESHAPLDEENARLWAEEADRRIERLEAGKTKLVPGEEVFAKIYSKYAK